MNKAQRAEHEANAVAVISLYLENTESAYRYLAYLANKVIEGEMSVRLAAGRIRCDYGHIRYEGGFKLNRGRSITIMENTINDLRPR